MFQNFCLWKNNEILKERHGLHQLASSWEIYRWPFASLGASALPHLTPQSIKSSEIYFCNSPLTTDICQNWFITYINAKTILWCDLIKLKGISFSWRILIFTFNLKYWNRVKKVPSLIFSYYWYFNIHLFSTDRMEFDGLSWVIDVCFTRITKYQMKSLWGNPQLMQ